MLILYFINVYISHCFTTSSHCPNKGWLKDNEDFSRENFYPNFHPMKKYRASFGELEIKKGQFQEKWNMSTHKFVHQYSQQHYSNTKIAETTQMSISWRMDK